MPQTSRLCRLPSAPRAVRAAPAAGAERPGATARGPPLRRGSFRLVSVIGFRGRDGRLQFHAGISASSLGTAGRVVPEIPGQIRVAHARPRGRLRPRP